MPKVKSRPKPSINLPAGLSKAFVNDLLSSLPEDGFKVEYLKSEMLSKYCDPSTTSPKLRARAGVAKWLSAERAKLRDQRQTVHRESAGH